MTLSGNPSNNPKLRLAILILAAGAGGRLGGYPKAILKKDGSTLLKRLIHSIKGFNPTETLVVTGFYPDEVEGEIESLQNSIQSPITWIRNPNPEAGQSSSVRLGLEALQSDYDALLIALCDQPNVGAQEVESLLEQFNQRSANQEIVLPIVSGQRGNPVLFSKEVIRRILAIPEMVCRPYMDQHPELVKIFDTCNCAYILDVDTQDDIQKLGLDKIKP
ncbi:nucleotidyltransferase family protein [Polynucleobacter sp. Ross1-W9]|uniref:nucleotidyltransferase family protein n=1 Tax=Polynucleobacter parvulilacunae TaxID=1855631 RepID=UPI001C0AFB33|nr:nucleotidyltransferase family protein [Polynucleobacter parvulilacunae]MBU3557861.1 nucleotidyltransferase family protein [Polynucleobacter parvulilacunae]